MVKLPYPKLESAATRAEVDALAARPLLLQRLVYEKMTPIEREIEHLENLLRLPDTRSLAPQGELN